MNVKIIWTKIRLPILCMVIGIILGIGGFYLIGSGSLSRSLATVKSELTASQAANRLATIQVSSLSKTASDQATIIEQQRRELASNQSIIASQKRLLDQTESELAGLKQLVQVTGGSFADDLTGAVKAFDNWYASSGQGAGTGKSP